MKLPKAGLAPTVSVRTDVTCPFGGGVGEAGLKAGVTPVGGFTTLKVTAVLNELTDEIVMVLVTLPPGDALRVVGFAEMVKEGKFGWSAWDICVLPETVTDPDQPK